MIVIGGHGTATFGNEGLEASHYVLNAGGILEADARAEVYHGICECKLPSNTLPSYKLGRRATSLGF